VDQSRPLREDRWQRSRDLANSEVRKVRSQRLGTLGCERQSREKIGTAQLREDRWRRSRDLVNSKVCRVRSQELSAPRHEVAK
jgi:hypothetical protein